MELNARPIKKVAEAKARKKMKEVKRMEKLKAKATLVAQNSEMSEQAKMRGLRRKKGVGCFFFCDFLFIYFFFLF